MLRPGSAISAQQPTAAERVRTLVESNASASLTIPGTELDEPGLSTPESRAVAASGEVMLLIPARAPAARAAVHAQGDDLTAVMEITDVAPVSVPHRIRGRGWVAGWLTAVAGSERAAAAQLLARRHPAGPVPGPEWTMLRLEVGEAYTDDLWGAAQVEPDEFAAASPDPLARHEAELLQHLAASHETQLRSLCALLGDRGNSCGAWRQVVPLGLDRFGLRVRFCAGEHCFDARFDFPEPVRDVTELRRAMRHLFEAAAVEE
ncbi:DUF2470 domain-containing protein [Streptomyces xiamenensis]